MPRPASPAPPADNLPLAVAVIVIAVLALSLGDALIKLSSADFVLWQIFVLRSAIALPVLVIAMAITAPAALSLPPALGWTAVRSLMLVVMWIAYYVALPHLQLSVAAAAYYTSPIFITLFSALLKGERIRRLGWLAVLTGFAGVLLVLRPRAGDFNLFALLPLLSAVLYALAMILTRTKCRVVHPLALSAALNLGFVATGIAATVLIGLLAGSDRGGLLLAPWTAMGHAEWGAMALLAAAILIGSIGAAIAYQKGPPAVIGTFDFAYVGFAALWGALLFAEVPDTLSLIGIVLIVVAGSMTLRR